MSENKSARLHYQDGVSDKVYFVDLKASPQGNGFLVDFAYGRRGAALNAGSKTPAPLPYDKALKIFNKLVAEKKAKGYDNIGGPAADSEGVRNDGELGSKSGIAVQLLNPVEPGSAEFEEMMRSPEWVMQRKYDGVRFVVRMMDGKARGINRTGKYVGIPETLAKTYETAGLPDGAVFDGELVGDKHFVFDLLQVGDRDLRKTSYIGRFGLLEGAIGMTSSFAKDGNVVLADTAKTPADKKKMFAHANANDLEGVVFKRADAPFQAGRPNKGGDQIKVKLWSTATVKVAEVNADAAGGPRSIRVAVKDKVTGGWHLLGNVTIPPNHKVPAKDDVVEVRYLYVLDTRAALYQPVYLGPRTDMSLDDVENVSDLKVKEAGLKNDDAKRPSPTTKFSP
ncbi:MAG: DNA ligase [Azospirillum sp.]|nr:DNA ligase [Azospirillum sp.]